MTPPARTWAVSYDTPCLVIHGREACVENSVSVCTLENRQLSTPFLPQPLHWTYGARVRKACLHSALSWGLALVILSDTATKIGSTHLLSNLIESHFQTFWGIYKYVEKSIFQYVLGWPDSFCLQRINLVWVLFFLLYVVFSQEAVTLEAQAVWSLDTGRSRFGEGAQEKNQFSLPRSHRFDFCFCLFRSLSSPHQPSLWVKTMLGGTALEFSRIDAFL